MRKYDLLGLKTVFEPTEKSKSITPWVNEGPDIVRFAVDCLHLLSMLENFCYYIYIIEMEKIIIINM